MREATGRRGQPGPATARHIRDGNRRFGLSHRGSAATVEGDRGRRPTGEGEAAARRWRPTLNLHLQTCGLLRVEELSPHSSFTPALSILSPSEKRDLVFFSAGFLRDRRPGG